MERDVILEKYRQEGVDEGRNEVNRRGDDAGFYALCGLSVLLMIYQAFTHQVFGDVAAVLFVFCSVGAFARYRTERDRFFLGMGVLTGALCLGCLGWYAVAHAVKRAGRRLMARPLVLPLSAPGSRPR